MFPFTMLLDLHYLDHLFILPAFVYRNHEHVVFNITKLYLSIFCIGKCEFRKNNLRHLFLLWILLLGIFSETCSWFTVKLHWFKLWHLLCLNLGKSKVTPLLSFSLIWNLMISWAGRSGITIGIIWHDFICGAASLKWTLLVHCKELQTCKYFWDCSIKKNNNLKDRRTL